MSSYTDIKITIEQAEQIAFDLFAIKGKACQLPGEIDLNFQLKTEKNESFILKVSRPNADLDYLDFQNKILQYIEASENNGTSPKIITDKEGHQLAEYTDENDQLRLVRLLTWIDGRLWSSVNPILDNLRFSLGQQCGALTRILQGFDH